MVLCDDCCPCIISLIVLCVFILLYNLSTTFHYYVRITTFYLSVLFHGVECMVTQFPGYVKNQGADYVLNSFYYWCKWTGIKDEVRGYEEVFKGMDGPAIVVCNHQSALDIFSMACVWPPRCVVMMKRSLLYIPFFNIAAILSRTIFIDRFNRDKAQQQVDSCVEQLKRGSYKLWVFPEGTRNRSGEGMLPFKKGAFNMAVRAQIPIVPIVVSNIKPFYSKNQKYFKNDGEIIIQVLPAVSTKGLIDSDVPELSDRVRNQMLEVYEKISVEAAERMAAKRAKKTA